MDLKKLFFRGAILTLLAFAFTACSDDDDDEPNYWIPPLSTTQGAYILNSGDLKFDDAAIAYYDKETKVCSAGNVFESVNNGIHLGNTGQDMLVTEDKIFIAVTNSGVIYVTDLKCKILETIISTDDKNEPQKPRGFTTYGDYVYVTYYNGYVARINKKTLKLDEQQVKVGRNPEWLRIANGKIYVANTGGMDYPDYDNTVSVIDLNKFEKIDDITVRLNAEKVEVDRYGNVYVISLGKYGEIPSLLQRIDTQEDKVVAELGEANLMRISPNGEQLYTITYNYTDGHEYKVYDIKSGEFLEKRFVDSSVTFSADPYSLSIDPETKNIYIGVSSYIAEGEMYIISPETGKVLDHFKTGGLNPMGAYFIK